MSLMLQNTVMKCCILHSNKCCVHMTAICQGLDLHVMFIFIFRNFLKASIPPKNTVLNSEQTSENLEIYRDLAKFYPLHWWPKMALSLLNKINCRSDVIHAKYNCTHLFSNKCIGCYLRLHRDIEFVKCYQCKV